MTVCIKQEKELTHVHVLQRQESNITDKNCACPPFASIHAMHSCRMGATNGPPLLLQQLEQLVEVNCWGMIGSKSAAKDVPQVFDRIQTRRICWPSHLVGSLLLQEVVVVMKKHYWQNISITIYDKKATDRNRFQPDGQWPGCVYIVLR